MKRFVGIFDNGYPSCENRLYFVADNEEQVNNYMDERLYDYALDYAYCCINTEDDECEEWQAYYEDCDYYVTEIEEDCEDYDDIDELWIDLRN